MLFCKFIATPVGRLKLIASRRGLAAVLWESDHPSRVRLVDSLEVNDHACLLQAQAELLEYFTGTRRTFSVPLDLRGTPFQQQVWRALLAIPFGETRSYGQLAAQLSHPMAARAVGAANGRNPVSILVPCHRVVSATGRLTGFAGGLPVKAALLAMEQAACRLPFE